MRLYLRFEFWCVRGDFKSVKFSSEHAGCSNLNASSERGSCSNLNSPISIFYHGVDELGLRDLLLAMFLLLGGEGGTIA